MLAWLRRRRVARLNRKAQVAAYVADMIARFGDQAYYVARDRDRDERKGVVVDAARPGRHWSAVKAEIAKVTGRKVGLDTATRYPQD